MIDNITVITKGGLVIWTQNFIEKGLKGNPINKLIQEIFIQEKGSQSSFSDDTYTLKWSFQNELDLIFIIVYQKLFSISYIDELLTITKEKFVEELDKSYKDVKDLSLVNIDFSEEFSNITRAVEERYKKEKIIKQTPLEKESKKETPNEDTKTNLTMETTVKKEEEIGLTKTKSTKVMKKYEPKDDKKKPKDDKKNDKKPIKVDTVWEDTDKYDVKTSKLLNQNEIDEDLIEKNYKDFQKIYNPEENSKTEIDKEDDFDEQNYKMKIQEKKTGFFSFLGNLTGKELDKEDLDPVIEKFKKNLQEKNVAGKIADEICDSVIKSLVGKKIGTFDTIYNTSKVSIEETLTRILTPKKSIDVLRDIMKAREEQRPYVITFCGVNGVGKSTRYILL
jgi:signal recognition particle receptor subunit alpha